MLVAVMTTYTDEYIFSSIIKGIEQELSKAGYGMAEKSQWDLLSGVSETGSPGGKQSEAGRFCPGEKR